jgi:1-acyl-sn-glycerol-3-phosphate acyltransferase
MNRQPYGVPPQSWTSKLNPTWIRCAGSLRKHSLKKQQIVKIAVEGADHVSAALNAGHGMLLTPNHSFHYDSYVLAEASQQLGRPFHVLAAWQVFAMSSRFEQWSLEQHGCFSIDREGNDIGAFKQAVEILRASPYPLVVFPEGDIYHTNDRVAPFRDGAAAMALSAARKAERKVVCVPCAMKLWYLTDPTPRLMRVMDKLEQRFGWRPRSEAPLADRIYRFGEAALSVKEVEFLGRAQPGDLPSRLKSLQESLLAQLEERHKVTKGSDSVPERVKELRKALIAMGETDGHFAADMETLHFVIQLYSFPGDYVIERPSIERIAETIDKLEEDVLGVAYPAIKGQRGAVVRFGKPIEVSAERGNRSATATLTAQLHAAIQGMLDDLNARGLPCWN